MKTLIVDDEPLARQRIRLMLDRFPDVDAIGECSNGVQAVDAIEALEPDLVFLDIQMPLLDGFGVVEHIGASKMPATLFVTAFDHYAQRAFEAQALDYLLKPFEPARFQIALERARRWLKGKEPKPTYDGLLAAHRQRHPWIDRMVGTSWRKSHTHPDFKNPVD